MCISVVRSKIIYILYASHLYSQNGISVSSVTGNDVIFEKIEVDSSFSGAAVGIYM